jgi:hypothetical protein
MGAAVLVFWTPARGFVFVTVSISLNRNVFVEYTSSILY